MNSKINLRKAQAILNKSRRPQKVELTEQMEADIKRDLNNGMTPKAVSLIYGVDMGTVKKWC